MSFRLVGKLIPSQLYSSACSLNSFVIRCGFLYRMKVSCYTPFEAVVTILVLWINNFSHISQIFGRGINPLAASGLYFVVRISKRTIRVNCQLLPFCWNVAKLSRILSTIPPYMFFLSVPLKLSSVFELKWTGGFVCITSPVAIFVLLIMHVRTSLTFVDPILFNFSITNFSTSLKKTLDRIPLFRRLHNFLGYYLRQI